MTQPVAAVRCADIILRYIRCPPRSFPYALVWPSGDGASGMARSGAAQLEAGMHAVRLEYSRNDDNPNSAGLLVRPAAGPHDPVPMSGTRMPCVRTTAIMLTGRTAAGAHMRGWHRAVFLLVVQRTPSRVLVAEIRRSRCSTSSRSDQILHVLTDRGVGNLLCYLSGELGGR